MVQRFDTKLKIVVGLNFLLQLTAAAQTTTANFPLTDAEWVTSQLTDAERVIPQWTDAEWVIPQLTDDEECDENVRIVDYWGRETALLSPKGKLIVTAALPNVEAYDNSNLERLDDLDPDSGVEEGTEMEVSAETINRTGLIGRQIVVGLTENDEVHRCAGKGHRPFMTPFMMCDRKTAIIACKNKSDDDYYHSCYIDSEARPKCNDEGEDRPLCLSQASSSMLRLQRVDYVCVNDSNPDHKYPINLRHYVFKPYCDAVGAPFNQIAHFVRYEEDCTSHQVGHSPFDVATSTYKHGSLYRLTKFKKGIRADATEVEELGIVCTLAYIDKKKFHNKTLHFSKGRFAVGHKLYKRLKTAKQIHVSFHSHTSFRSKHFEIYSETLKKHTLVREGDDLLILTLSFASYLLSDQKLKWTGNASVRFDLDIPFYDSDYPNGSIRDQPYVVDPPTCPSGMSWSHSICNKTCGKMSECLFQNQTKDHVGCFECKKRTTRPAGLAMICLFVIFLLLICGIIVGSWMRKKKALKPKKPHAEPIVEVRVDDGYLPQPEVDAPQAVEQPQMDQRPQPQEVEQPQMDPPPQPQEVEQPVAQPEALDPGQPVAEPAQPEQQ